MPKGDGTERKDDGITLLWKIPLRLREIANSDPNGCGLSEEALDDLDQCALDVQSFLNHARRGISDTVLLDYLQSLTKGYGEGWIVRRSSRHHRGMRLHETSRGCAVPSIRDAIKKHRAAGVCDYCQGLDSCAVHHDED